MSSASAGKFQDHYDVLGLEVRAEPETIHRAYEKFAKLFHPTTGAAADQAKFDAVTLAFEVLIDPELRRDFDKLKGVEQKNSGPRFTGQEFFNALGRGSHLRIAILCVLYDRRRVKPSTPSLSMRQLENLLQAETAELEFELWYLKQKNFAASDDKSSLMITVEGMDYLEANQPSPDLVMHYVRREPHQEPESEGEKEPVAEPAPEPDPVSEPAASITQPVPSARERAAIAILRRNIGPEASRLKH